MVGKKSWQEGLAPAKHAAKGWSERLPDTAHLQLTHSSQQHPSPMPKSASKVVVALAAPLLAVSGPVNTNGLGLATPFWSSPGSFLVWPFALTLVSKAQNSEDPPGEAEAGLARLPRSVVFPDVKGKRTILASGWLSVPLALGPGPPNTFPPQ